MSLRRCLACFLWIPLPAFAHDAGITSVTRVFLSQLGDRRYHLVHRWPWLVAVVFGLIHGLGFAGALGQLGLASEDIPFALLFVNLGDEAGQLAIVAVVLIVVRTIRCGKALTAWVQSAPGIPSGPLPPVVLPSSSGSLRSVIGGFPMRSGQRPRLGFVALLALALLLPSCQRREAVDVILHGGQVLTVNEAFTIHTALAIKDGRILAVGGEEISTGYEAPLRIDLRGRTLMPGFTDTHIHIRTSSQRDVDLGNVASIAELQDRVRAKAKELGPGEWITGFGWDEALFAERRNPVRADLDAAAQENPVVLTRAGGHSSVGNSRALAIAGITRDTPDPESGLIEHDPNGEPNGIIRERSDLYRMHVPPAAWENLRESYVASLKALLPLGITSVMDASGTIDDEPVGKGGIENPSSRVTYRRLREIYERQGDELPRVALYISYPGRERLEAYPNRTGFGDDRLRIGPIGESGVDGGFTGPTAWTLADYKEMPGFRGKGRYSDEELQELVDTCARKGWQMGLHAIGDAAIVQTVNAYSKAIRTIMGTEKDHRWFLDHFTVMPPDETMKTMAEDRILIAQQPNFTYNLEGRYVATLDDERAAHTNSVATPWKKFGLFVAFGSDNLPIGPMMGLYTAVTRKGMSGTVYGPEEKVSIQDALRMYTANGPYLTWEEKSKGTLEAGKLADMIVLDADPLTIPPEELLKTNVDLTIVGGKVVYDRAQSPPSARAIRGDRR